MKILLVSGPGISLKEPYNSGIEAFIVSFANQLVDEGHTVDVIAHEAEASARFKIINPFTLYPKVIPGLFKQLKEERQFKNLVVSSYDVIHYNMFYPHLLKAGLYFNKPSFLTLHSPADKKRISAYKQLTRRSDVRFVAISARIKTQWEQALGKNLPLIDNGIDLRLWPTIMNREDKYLLWSARINEEKNVADAIRLAKHMQLPLKIAGRIVDQNYFDNQVKPHLTNQIEYVGHLTQRELSSLSTKASVYLATATWQEPFGLAALEMLASGVPVVGFSTAVPPDWNHECVLTTTSQHWRDLEPLVRRSHTIKPGACKEFASNLSIQKMTSNYVQLYNESLMKKGNREQDQSGENRLLIFNSKQPQTLK